MNPQTSAGDKGGRGFKTRHKAHLQAYPTGSKAILRSRQKTPFEYSRNISLLLVFCDSSISSLVVIFSFVIVTSIICLPILLQSSFTSFMACLSFYWDIQLAVTPVFRQLALFQHAQHRKLLEGPAECCFKTSRSFFLILRFCRQGTYTAWLILR